MGLLSLLPIIAIALLLRRRLQSAPAVSLLHSVAILLVVLFAGGLLDLLWWTTLAIHIGGVVLLGVETWLLTKKSARFAVPVPYAILPILTVAFWLVHGNSQLYFYDEYAHWGVFIKETLAADAFWPAETNSMHPRYPPGPTLWQYFFNAFLPYSEGRVYVGQFVLLITPLLVLWEGLRWRQIAWIAGLLVLCVSALSLFGLGVRSLYVDHVLGTWFAGSLLAFVIDRHRTVREIWPHAASLCVLALIKDVGVAFALSASAIMALILLRREWTSDARVWKPLGRSATLFAALGLPAVLCVLLWTWNRDSIGAPHDIQSVRGISAGLIASGASSDEKVNEEITRRFREVFVHQQLSNDEVSWQFNAFTYPIRELFQDRFRLTTFWFLAIYVGWWLALIAFMRPQEERWTWGIMAAGLLLSSVGYFSSLYLSYRFAFGEKGLLLSSYLRYAQSIVLPMLLVSVSPLLPGFNTEAAGAKTLTSRHLASAGALKFSAVLLALLVFERPFVLPTLFPNPRHDVRQQLEPAARAVQTVVGASRLWVYLPYDQPNEFVGWLLTYLLTPTPVIVEREPDAFRHGPSALATAWRDIDYVWIVGPLNQDEAETLARLTDRPPTFGLFRVARDATGELRVHQVAESSGK